MEHSHHSHEHSHGSAPACESCEAEKKGRPDFLLWGTTLILLFSYLGFSFFTDYFHSIAYLGTFMSSTFELLNQMAWGIALGIIFVGVLDKIPQQLIIASLGRGGTFSGLLRATAAGVMLDLCSHGILLVGMQLYKKGASLGQTMAFLIASPWNSLSLTFILWALLGFWWMITFLILSMVIGIISGFIFEGLVRRKVLPKNPNQIELPEGFKFWPSLKSTYKDARFNIKTIWKVIRNGIFGSKMILRWIFFGVILASLVRTFISPESFQTFFGPTLAGLGLTVIVATILEVCSEGSAPVAADLLTRAGAPGNSFAFLMTGVSTDYTEILALKETTKSWKISFFLPLVTLPQILILAWAINYLAV